MAYVKCHDCGQMVHFKPIDVIEFHKKYVKNNEPIYCSKCFKNRGENKKS